MGDVTGVKDFLVSRPEVTAVAAMAVGVVYCFLGYRTLRFVIGLTGFALAGAAAAVLTAVFILDNWLAVAAAGVLGGLAGAFTLLVLYKAGVFFLGALGAAVVVQAAVGDRSNPWALWAVLGAAVTGGLMALLVERSVMILVTAALGAWIAVVSGLFLATGLMPSESLDRFGLGAEKGWVVMICWVLLSGAGALTQAASYREKPPPIDQKR